MIKVVKGCMPHLMHKLTNYTVKDIRVKTCIPYNVCDRLRKISDLVVARNPSQIEF